MDRIGTVSGRGRRKSSWYRYDIIALPVSPSINPYLSSCSQYSVAGPNLLQAQKDIVRMALEVISKPISTMPNDCKQIILFDLSLCRARKMAWQFRRLCKGWIRFLISSEGVGEEQTFGNRLVKSQTLWFCRPPHRHLSTLQGERKKIREECVGRKKMCHYWDWRREWTFVSLSGPDKSGVNLIKCSSSTHLIS